MTDQNKLIAGIVAAALVLGLVIVLGNRFLVPQMIVKPDQGDLPPQAQNPDTLGREAAALDIPANANPFHTDADAVRFFVGYATERRAWRDTHRDNRGRGMPIGTPDNVGVPAK
jgi:hypothetical protein